MRERIRKAGIGSLEEHELLEYLLYSFVPRRDTNALAHELITRFGSFAAVLNANEHDLAEVTGMTENAALFLTSLPEVCRKYTLSVEENEGLHVKGRGEVAKYVRSLLWDKTTEHVYVLSFDSHDVLVRTRLLAQGSTKAAALSAHDVVSEAISARASSVVLAHNHPEGEALPSDADIALTNTICSALALIGIRLSDHFVVAKNGVYSFNTAGYTVAWQDELHTLLDGSRFRAAAAEPFRLRDGTVQELNPKNTSNED